MIKVVTGENASGKTLFLKSVMDGVYFSRDYITNIEWESNPYKDIIPYDERKEDLLSELLETDEDKIFNKTGVDLSNEHLSTEGKIMIDLLSRKVDAVYLDEPELNLGNRELTLVINYIARIESLHKCVYIVTHECGFMALIESEGQLFTMNEEGNLLPVKGSEVCNAFN